VKDTFSHLEPSQQDMLLSLLLDYESLFDDTLGDWNRPPVSIKMKDGAKPYHMAGHTPYRKYIRQP